ncbi:MAG: DUF4332 domain-containing protein [Anaerolineae bacterium]
MANMRISEIRGMTADAAAKLKSIGITDSNKLFEKARTLADRRNLAKELGLEASQVLEYFNRADLARIKGIGPQFSNLLEDAGVDSVKELAHRRADHLYEKLSEVAKAGGQVKRLPRPADVEKWIAQAKEMATHSE